jgi:DNA replication and repair protein RecF
VVAAPRPARITRLDLHQARSYESLRLDLSVGATVLVGPNGVGKTNLLEACAIVLSGSSPRTSSELRLVREGQDAARIAAWVRIGDDEHERDVVLRVGRGKQLRIDGSVCRSLDEYGAQVPVVTFLPERLLTIRGAPQRRRALVDQLAIRLLPAAAATQRSYTAALAQRNVLLRRAKAGHAVDDQIAPWSQQLAAHGEQLRAQRAQVLAALAQPLSYRFEQLTALPDATFAAELRGSGDLAADLEQLAAAERRRGSTLTGPHLDELLPRQAGRDLRAFGSAGEQRAALLAFTLAARDLLEHATGIQPVVLLDEPWSELDAARRRRLTSMLAPLAQVIVTSTEPPSHLDALLPAACVLQVSSGAVEPWTSDADGTD